MKKDEKKNETDKMDKNMSNDKKDKWNAKRWKRYETDKINKSISRWEKYKVHKLNINILKYILKCWLNDIDTQVIDTNFLRFKINKKMISIFKKQIHSHYT